MYTFSIKNTEGNLIAELNSTDNRWSKAIEQAINNDINLAGADFQSLDLDGLQAAGGLLVGANFSQSSLVNADFSEANLTNVSFCHADLSGAIFSGSTITLTTDFSQAVMTGSKYDFAED